MTLKDKRYGAAISTIPNSSFVLSSPKDQYIIISITSLYVIAGDDSSPLMVQNDVSRFVITQSSVP